MMTSQSSNCKTRFKASEKRESCWTWRNPDWGDQELRTRNNSVGTEPAQWVCKNTPLTETLETGTCCCPSDTRKGPIEPEKLQTNFPFVSPVHTVWAPDTEPPVSHYRTHPDTRAGWLPPRQILYCPGGQLHPAHGSWIWNRENHRHSPRRYLGCLRHCQPSETAWEGLQHDKGLPPDVHDSHSTREPSFLRGTWREKKQMAIIEERPTTGECPRATSIQRLHKRPAYSPGHAQLCVCRRPCCRYTEHGLCTDRGNIDRRSTTPQTSSARIRWRRKSASSTCGIMNVANCSTPAGTVWT